MPMTIYLVIIGIAAGFLATRIMKVNAGIAETIAIGIAGALIGGILMRFILVATGLVGGLVGAVVGSMLLIWLWKTFVKR